MGCDTRLWLPRPAVFPMCGSNYLPIEKATRRRGVFPSGLVEPANISQQLGRGGGETKKKVTSYTLQQQTLS